MTVDELRSRKRELMAQQKYELGLQAKGEGDNLNLFMIREELLDVNDQLRALTIGRRKSGGRAALPNRSIDRQQYLEWRHEETTPDTETKDDRTIMGRAAVAGMDLLRPRQREMMELFLSGMSVTAIANKLGVDKSTASRVIGRAKKNLREETGRAMDENQLLADSNMLDLRDPAVAKTVFLALTPKQTVYFYLYYSECLTFREIETLTGIDHSAIVRTLRRALRNISTLLGGQEAVLAHPEALDELAYQAYCQLEDHPELLPESVQALVPYSPPEKRMDPRVCGHPPPMDSLPISVLHRRRHRYNSANPPGKILSALLEQQGKKEGPLIFRWLESVFAAFLTRLRKQSI